MIVLSSCNKNDNSIELIHYSLNDLKFEEFALDDGRSRLCKSFMMNDSTIFVTIPSGCDLTKMKTVFSYKGAYVCANDIKQISGVTEMDYSDFTNPVVFSIYTELGEKKDYKVLLFDLPVVIINTPENTPVKNKTDWVNNSNMRIIDTDGTVLYNGETGIKGRGNVSWTSYQKKSYSLKLNDKAKILDMAKSKRWVLLGHSADYTKIRTPLSFKICEMVGIEWAPTGKNVELILNDTILCNYYMCEQIRAEKNRINITEMNPADTIGEAITGGYLLEVSQEYDEQYKFRSQFFDMPFMLKSPNENVSDKQLEWIETYINLMEESLMDDEKVKAGEYKKYLDEESFVKWWIVNEICTNIEESKTNKNFYLYKERGYDSILKASSPWDFDWGTFRSVAVDEWICKDTKYYSKLFKNEGFVNKTKQIWMEFYANRSKIFESYIEKLRLLNEKSVKRDRNKYPKDQNDTPTNLDNHMTYEMGVDYIKDVLFHRIEWLNTHINNMIVE